MHPSQGPVDGKFISRALVAFAHCQNWDQLIPSASSSAESKPRLRDVEPVSVCDCAGGVTGMPDKFVNVEEADACACDAPDEDCAAEDGSGAGDVEDCAENCGAGDGANAAVLAGGVDDFGEKKALICFIPGLRSRRLRKAIPLPSTLASFDNSLPRACERESPLGFSGAHDQSFSRLRLSPQCLLSMLA